MQFNDGDMEYEMEVLSDLPEDEEEYDDEMEELSDFDMEEFENEFGQQHL